MAILTPDTIDFQTKTVIRDKGCYIMIKDSLQQDETFRGVNHTFVSKALMLINYIVLRISLLETHSSSLILLYADLSRTERSEFAAHTHLT